MPCAELPRGLPAVCQEPHCALLLLGLLLVADCCQQLAVMRERHSNNLKVMLLQQAASSRKNLTCQLSAHERHLVANYTVDELRAFTVQDQAECAT